MLFQAGLFFFQVLCPAWILHSYSLEKKGYHYSQYLQSGTELLVCLKRQICGDLPVVFADAYPYTSTVTYQRDGFL